MLDINGWEFVFLIVIAVVVIGPKRLPEYAAKLAQGIRQLRVMAEGAKGQLKEQLGEDYQDIDWRQYDPRQYDPRRIVREALSEPLNSAMAPLKDEIDAVNREVNGVRDAARSAANGSSVAASAVTAAGAAGAVASSPGTANVMESLTPASTVTLPTPYDVEAT